jgi:hypothetical protein
MKESFDPKEYKKIPYDDLLVFALLSVMQKGLNTSFENLVVECYELFPQRFGLPGFIEKYPDSAQIEKTWLRCRSDKGLIVGSKARGFDITARGLEVVQRTQKRLGKKVFDVKQLIASKGDLRTKSGRIIKQIENNQVFKSFHKEGKGMKISDYEFCDLIYSTLDSLPEYRRRNLQQLREAAEDYHRKDIIDFLSFCEDKFSHLLFSEKERGSNYAGGMTKRKIKRL